MGCWRRALGMVVARGAGEGAAIVRHAKRGYAMSATTFVEGSLREARHALRMLQRNPAFSLTVILTLALGIGATTAIFSVVNAVVIKPLAYPSSESVVSVGHS